MQNWLSSKALSEAGSWLRADTVDESWLAFSPSCMLSVRLPNPSLRELLASSLNLFSPAGSLCFSCLSRSVSLFPSLGLTRLVSLPLSPDDLESISLSDLKILLAARMEMPRRM